MIIWISGNSGAGKTTLAKALIGDQKHIVHLDGDDVRDKNKDYDFSREGRWNNCLAVAGEALRYDKEGFCVIVSVIAPYRKLREEIKKLCGCTFLYVINGRAKRGKRYPYERPARIVKEFRFHA